MKIDQIHINKALEKAKLVLGKESISPQLRVLLNILFQVIPILLERLGLNSKNSSIPPSQDPKRSKESNGGEKDPERKPGGQKGHPGKTLEPFENPDEIIDLPVDLKDLPEGPVKEVGYVSRQVVDVVITRHVTEYRAQVVVDANGQRHQASFPDDISNPVQYGTSVKAQAVYLSQSQLIPFKRVEDYFCEQLGFPVSAGSIYNFNERAYELLDQFEAVCIKQLILSELIHVDETGINVNKKRKWLHCASNACWTLFYPHDKRGREAMDELGILPHFSGIMVHDHWKSYYSYDCDHALCNAHHLRELQGAWDRDHHQWALDMKALLLTINQKTQKNGGKLDKKEKERLWLEYDTLLDKAEEECPPPSEEDRKGKRGRLARSKSRNLLERLKKYKGDTLRFSEDQRVSSQITRVKMILE